MLPSNLLGVRSNVSKGFCGVCFKCQQAKVEKASKICLEYI
jgi:hypothetical protein